MNMVIKLNIFIPHSVIFANRESLTLQQQPSLMFHRKNCTLGLEFGLETYLDGKQPLMEEVFLTSFRPFLDIFAKPQLQPNLAEVSSILDFSTPPTHPPTRESSKHG